MMQKNTGAVHLLKRGDNNLVYGEAGANNPHPHTKRQTQPQHLKCALSYFRLGCRGRKEQHNGQFLVACYVTLHSALSVCLSIHPSIGLSTFWAAAPKGPMTYAFTQGKFLLLLLLLRLYPPPLETIFEDRGPNPCLEAQIPASRPKSQPRGPNPSLEAQIPALRPKSQP